MNKKERKIKLSKKLNDLANELTAIADDIERTAGPKGIGWLYTNRTPTSLLIRTVVFALEEVDNCFDLAEKKKFWDNIWPVPKAENYSRKDFI